MARKIGQSYFLGPETTIRFYPALGYRTSSDPREERGDAMAPSSTGHNLIQVLTAMRNYGIGTNVRRTVWKNPGCYWTVTR